MCMVLLYMVAKLCCHTVDTFLRYSYLNQSIIVKIM